MAFVIDVFARRIVGWRVLTSMTTGFVPDRRRRIAIAHKDKHVRDGQFGGAVTGADPAHQDHLKPGMVRKILAVIKVAFILNLVQITVTVGVVIPPVPVSLASRIPLQNRSYREKRRSTTSYVIIRNGTSTQKNIRFLNASWQSAAR